MTKLLVALVLVLNACSDPGIEMADATGGSAPVLATTSPATTGGSAPVLATTSPATTGGSAPVLATTSPDLCKSTQASAACSRLVCDTGTVGEQRATLGTSLIWCAKVHYSSVCQYAATANCLSSTP
jgi:hypothetical protein